MLQKMNQSWQGALKQENLQKKIEYSSYSQNNSKQIFKALLFWEFIKRGFRESLHDCMENISDGDRKAFLMQYVDHKNPYIALIAKIEMLPTKVWRKLLWRYNIDFLSLESFLRRIFFKENKHQKEAIFAAWDDLYQKKATSAVLYVRFWDRFMMTIYVVMKFLGMEKFIPDFTSFDGEVRYRSKGAWSYNLAHLDFGFSKYIHGTKSDEQDTSILTWGMKAKKFFSFKNHVNDFSTNDEDGIYWFFYRFVRNWGFILPRKIKLSDWVCPGFWTTLIGFFVFLALPFVSLLFMPLIGWWTLLISAPVIIWAGVWLCKIIIGSLYFGIKKRSKFLSRIFIVLAIPSIMVCAVWLLSRLWLLFILIYTLLQSLPVGFMITILLLIGAEVGLLILRITYIREEVLEDNTISDSFSLKYITLALVISIISALVYSFWPPILTFLQSIFDAIQEFFTNYWIESLVLVLMVLIVTGFVKLSKKDYEEKVNRRIDFIFLSMVGILLTTLLYIFIKIALISISYIFIPLLIVFLSIVLGYTLYILSLRAEKIMDKRREDLIKRFADKNRLSRSTLSRYLYPYVSTNPSLEELQQLLDLLWDFSSDLKYPLSSHQYEVFEYLLSNLSLLTLNQEQLNYNTIEKMRNYSSDEFSRKWFLISFLRGLESDQIDLLLQQKQKEAELKDDLEWEKKIKRQKFWSRLFSPFTYVFGKVANFFDWFIDLISGLRIIVEIFHHYCPRNQTRKNL